MSLGVKVAKLFARSQSREAVTPGDLDGAELVSSWYFRNRSRFQEEIAKFRDLESLSHERWCNSSCKKMASSAMTEGVFLLVPHLLQMLKSSLVVIATGEILLWKIQH